MRYLTRRIARLPALAVVAAASGFWLIPAPQAHGYIELYCGSVPSAIMCSTTAGRHFVRNYGEFGGTSPAEYVCQTMTNGGDQRPGGSCAPNTYFVGHTYGPTTRYWRANCWFHDSTSPRNLHCLAET